MSRSRRQYDHERERQSSVPGLPQSRQDEQKGREFDPSFSCDNITILPNWTDSHSILSKDNYVRPHEHIEKPKPVASTRKRDVLLYSVIYHIPPVLVTVFFTVVYAQQWAWPAPRPSDATQAALQFVAKVHECLLILSLSNILYHRIRYLLIQSDAGIPLGLITTPFQLNNALFFVSPEFLGSLRKLLSTASTFLTFTLIIFISILSFAASPFSAVILLPREVNIPLAASHPIIGSITERGGIIGGMGADGLYLMATLPIPVDRLYPMSIGPELGVTWTCPSLKDRPGNCVSFFQSSFADIVANRLTSLSRPDSAILEKFDELFGFLDSYQSDTLSVFDDVFVLEELLVDWSPLSLLQRVTKPLGVVSDYLGSFKSNIRTAMEELKKEQYPFSATITLAGHNKTLPTLQPQILTHRCERAIPRDMVSVEYLTALNWAVPTKQSKNEICFTTGWYPQFNFTISKKLAEQLVQQNWTKGFLLFVDLQDHIPYPISGGYFAVTMPDTDTTTYVIDITYFIGQWAEASPSRIPSITRRRSGVIDRAVEPGELKSVLSLSSFNKTSDTIGPMVKMDAAWLNSLNIYPFEMALPGDGLPHLDDNARSLFDYVVMSPNALSDVPLLLASVMGKAQGMYLREHFADNYVCTAPGLRGCVFPGDDGAPIIEYQFAKAVPESEIRLPENEVEVRVKVEQRVWGYTFEGLTVVLAFIFLYLHVAIVVMHLSFIGFGGWNSMAWAGLTELIVLGIGSTSTDLLNHTGSGISKWKIWSYSTVVRKNVRVGKLEMVIRDPDGNSEEVLQGKEKPKPDVVYS